MGIVSGHMRTTGKSAKFEMRVPIAELADWQRRAAALEVPVAELIRLTMRQGEEPVGVHREAVPESLPPVQRG